MRPTMSAAAKTLGALTLALVAPLAATALPADAATSSGCTDGGFRVTLPSGKAVAGSAKIGTGTLSADARVAVRGRYVEFDFAPVTGNVYDYVYTGAANPQSLTNGVRTPSSSAE